MKRSAGNKRRVRRTILVVGEGDAEVNFLRHIRSLYTCDGQGCQLIAKNANGKGAKNVITKAIQAQGHYSARAALFDTDTTCTKAALAIARKNKIVLLTQEPCLEAWLLDVMRIWREGTTQEHKARFTEYFGHPAHDNGVFQRHFPKHVIDDARNRIDLINKVLSLLEV